MRFNADGPAGLLDRKAPGKTPLLGEAQRVALAQAVEAGPKPYLDGVVRWRLIDLVQWLRENFSISVSRQTLGRELRAMGFRKLSARPRHFGAICPAKGKGAGLVMPWCDTAAMQAHLEETSAAVAPGAHAVVILDQAGWHMSNGLDIPATSRSCRCASLSGVEPAGEHLAVYSRQLALQPDFRLLRRHR